MKRYLFGLALALLVPASFLGGYWYSRHQAAEQRPAGSRKILYYVDPMNPGFRSDKPGIAACGMPLEPVYADGGGARSDRRDLPPGSVQVGAEKQQLIGMRVEQAEITPLRTSGRLLGRVAADETRIYRINASTDGWIRSIPPVTTGTLVRKNEVLATFYAPEFLSAAQAYLYALGSLDRFKPSGNETREQLLQSNRNIENYKNSLRNLGMSDYQIEQIGRERVFGENVEIRAPAPGILLYRNVSLGQRFEKGTELFRIADLSRVWVLADLFENESQSLKPGTTVRVSLPQRNLTLPARVSRSLPLFDPASRTLKVRLELDNRGYLLRPDMFVDVELPGKGREVLSVPVDAVIDSGLKKTVYVDRGSGFFEPRSVETGRSAGERVEILRGLKPGERVVVSGNFLLDSESRMKTATGTAQGNRVVDPSCGMYVDEDAARSRGLTITRGGKTYYFCSSECKRQFEKSAPPAKGAGRVPAAGDGKSMSGGHHHE